MNKQQRLIEKMKALLAMSESKANENEAMTAARQLHALLAKHNISLTDLEQQDPDNQVGQFGTVLRDEAWKRAVGKYVANLYFCEFYVGPRIRKQRPFMFVGTPTNREFAIHIFTNIVKTIESEARRQSREIYQKHNSSFVRSFWIGARDRIIERCKELMEASKAGELQDEQGNKLPALLSLYDANQELLDRYLQDHIPNLVLKSSRTTSRNQLGRAKGYTAGNKVQLSRAIQNSPKNQAQLPHISK